MTDPATAPGGGRSAPWGRVGDAFARAVEILAHGGPLDEAVTRVCGENEALVDEVRSLLLAHLAQGPADELEQEFVHSGQAEDPRPGDRFGPYLVERELGRGGMGVVFAAKDERLRRTVALKVLPPLLTATPNASRRFRLEAQAAASLDHPNICAIHEIGETEEGWLYIAMPLYRGETVSTRLERGPLAVSEALATALGAARGLAHAHAHDIVHRDVKPANIFVTEEGQVRLLDFGIAKTADSTLTQSGMMLGTLPYMSPEQAAGEPVDARTDLWALGVVLYEMVSGRRPFEGKTPEATMTRILTAEPPPLVGIEGGSTATAVIDRLLVKAPRDRLPTAEAAVELLDTAVAALERGPTWKGADVTTPIAPEGERRHATALAMAVTRYQELVERLEPTVLQEALANLYEGAVEIARRHGGVVQDADAGNLLLLFGVPTTHEDDPVRAAWAARDLHRWVSRDWLAGVDGVAPRLRGGLSSGSLVIQPDRSSGRYVVVGDPITQARRLAAHSGEDDTLVAPQCERQLTTRFDLAPADPLPGDTNSPPLHPTRVVGEVSAFSTTPGRAASREVPMLGRDRELGELGEALRRARAGEGQFVVVVAEAGAGKTRLLDEFAVSAAGNGARWIRVGCVQREVGASPYGPWREVVADILGPGHLDRASQTCDAATRADVPGRLRELLPSAPDAVRALLDLLALSEDDGTRHSDPGRAHGHARAEDAVGTATVSLVIAATHALPLVLVLEDWHWADASSHQAMQQLAELVPAYPLFVVVSHRPGFGVVWPEVRTGKTLRLGPLDVAAVRSLACAVLEATTIEDRLVASLCERSGGNPFFVTELCRSLREESAVSIEGGHAAPAGSEISVRLPGTIQGVIRARLDRLDAGSRQVARAGSVIGRRFALGLLPTLVSRDVAIPVALERLKRAGLVHQSRLVPEPEYRFTHAIVQEVAYDSVLQHHRRTLHARVGKALEEANRERGEEIAGVLAYHFAEAEMWPRAVECARREAGHALRLSAYAEAAAMLERASVWCERLPAGEGGLLLEVLFELERVSETLGRRDRQVELLQRLESLCGEDPDDGPRTRLALREGDLGLRLGRHEAARAAYARALEMARGAGDRVMERKALNGLGFARLHSGAPEEAIRLFRAVLDIARSVGDKALVARDLYNLGSVQRAMGEIDEAAETFDRALRTQDASDDESFRPIILWQLANLERSRGRNDRALEIFRTVLEEDRRFGLEIEVAHVLLSMGTVLLELGDVEEALLHFRDAVTTSRGIAHADGLGQSLQTLGRVLAQLDERGEARACFLEAAEIFERLQDLPREATVWRQAAECAELDGDLPGAGHAWRRFGAARQTLGDGPGALQALLRAGRTLRDAARVPGSDPELPGRARRTFAEALDLAEALDEPGAAVELHNGAGILEWRVGAYEEALTHYGHMQNLARAIGDRERLGLALNSIGATLLCLNRPRQARVALEEALSVTRALGERALEGHSLAQLGDVDLATGNAPEARARYEASLALRRRIGDRSGEGWMLVKLARTAEMLDERERARSLRDEAAQIAEEVGDTELRAVATDSAGTRSARP